MTLEASNLDQDFLPADPSGVAFCVSGVCIGCSWGRYRAALPSDALLDLDFLPPRPPYGFLPLHTYPAFIHIISKASAAADVNVVNN